MDPCFVSPQCSGNGVKRGHRPPCTGDQKILFGTMKRIYISRFLETGTFRNKQNGEGLAVKFFTGASCQTKKFDFPKR